MDTQTRSLSASAAKALANFALIAARDVERLVSDSLPNMAPPSMVRNQSTQRAYHLRLVYLKIYWNPSQLTCHVTNLVSSKDVTAVISLDTSQTLDKH
jgi:hypothetical protein